MLKGGGQNKFLGTIVLKRELEVLAVLKGDVKRFQPALNGGGGAKKCRPYKRGQRKLYLRGDVKINQSLSQPITTHSLLDPIE